jgi:hypothetical protein
MAKVSFDHEKLAEAINAAVRILRMLERTNTFMTIDEFAKEIGLAGRSEKPQQWYRDQATYVLQIIDAMRCNGKPINIKRITYLSSEAA